MSTDRWVDNEDVVHIDNGILLSHKKKWNWVIWRDVDEPRVCYTEGSKSEREIQISYIKAYMRNLEKWYWLTYLQGGTGDAVQSRIYRHSGERGGETNEECSIDIYTLSCVK